MRIVISQRVDLYPERNERRDALDQTWGTLLDQWFGANTLIHPVANRPDATVQLLQMIMPDLIILSGGNDIGQMPERDDTEHIMLDHAAAARIPVLGVCRGLQMIQCHLGGSLVKVDGHIACAHPVCPVETQFDVLDVNSYHCWGIAASALSPNLRPHYRHADGSVEAAEHTMLPWLGVMWHPERMALGSPDSAQWIRNWLVKVIK